jgi:hypothetical protein
MRKTMTFIFLVVLVLALSAGPVLASDHLFNGATSPGASVRGFANPVAANPSGVAGAKAMPGTVPGEGNPNAGGELGTPAVDLELVYVRSGGHGNPVH